jgi:hypothetical protein
VNLELSRSGKRQKRCTRSKPFPAPHPLQKNVPLPSLSSKRKRSLPPGLEPLSTERKSVSSRTGGRASNARDAVLLSYGPDTVDIMRRSDSYVDRILRGAEQGAL